MNKIFVVVEDEFDEEGYESHYPIKAFVSEEKANAFIAKELLKIDNLECQYSLDEIEIDDAP
jgi:hypothetical protein